MGRDKPLEDLFVQLLEPCNADLADLRLMRPLLNTLQALFGIHEDIDPEAKERLVLAAAPYVLMLLDDIRCHVISALREGREPEDAVAFVFHNRYGFFIGDYDDPVAEEYKGYVEKALEKMRERD